MNDRVHDGLLIAQRMAERIAEGYDPLEYSEVEYLIFCKAYEAGEFKALAAYFASPRFEQMERRYQAEHCHLCGCEVDEEEQNAADEDSRHPQCEDCARELRLDRCYR